MACEIHGLEVDQRQIRLYRLVLGERHAAVDLVEQVGLLQEELSSVVLRTERAPQRRLESGRLVGRITREARDRAGERRRHLALDLEDLLEPVGRVHQPLRPFAARADLHHVLEVLVVQVVRDDQPFDPLGRVSVVISDEK